MWNDASGENIDFILCALGVAEMSSKSIRDYENLVAYYHNLKIINSSVEHL